MSKLLAWHFVGEMLHNGDAIPADGVVLRHSGPLAMCESGLHASVRIMDALSYAPGETVCRVECSGETIIGDDKLACRKRQILWRLDATEVLREFARWCALSVIDLWDAPAIVREYLSTGDESKRAAALAAAGAAEWHSARHSARAAARHSARHSALAAAGAVAGDSEWHVARHATRHVARGAALDAALGNARGAALDAQNQKLTAMVVDAHKQMNLIRREASCQNRGASR